MNKKHGLGALILVHLVGILYAANDISTDSDAVRLRDFLYRATYMGTDYSILTNRILTIVEQEAIPRDVYVSTVTKVSEEFIADTFVYTNRSGKMVTGFRKGGGVTTLIDIIGFLDEPNFLPWLEHQAMESDLAFVRARSAIAYVRIAGLDAVPFVRKILSGSREKYDIGSKAQVCIAFFDQIVKATEDRVAQEKIDDAYRMLIEHAYQASHVSEVSPIDKHLCQLLPNYSNSIQRKAIISRFLLSTNETVRRNYTQKFNELQQAPRSERTDLSVRFPGLMVMQDENEEREQIISITEDE